MLLFRGVNFSGAKTPADRPTHRGSDVPEPAEASGKSFVGRPLILDNGTADVHLAHFRAWGFNWLWYAFTWEAIKHEGPGKYDYKYIAYTIRILRRCKAFGFWVYMNPHQDVWSRFSGGSGAPYRTLVACGLNPRNFTTTQAVLLQFEHPDPASYPTMIWDTNNECFVAPLMQSGSQTVDPKGQTVWSKPETEEDVGDGSDDQINCRWGWRRAASWPLGECIWATHGVWTQDLNTKGEGRIIKPNYFKTIPSDPEHALNFIEDYWPPPCTSAARNIMRHQLGILKNNPPNTFGPYPTIIGETGVPMNMHSKRSYNTVNYTNQTRALDCSLNAADRRNILNWTLGNYLPDNTHQSRPIATVGTPIHLEFDIEKACFEMRVWVRKEDRGKRADEEEGLGIEVYILLVHFATNLVFEGKNGNRLENGEIGQKCQLASHWLLDILFPVRLDTTPSLYAKNTIGTLAYSDMFALDVKISDGRWSLDGQILKWRYDVPNEGEKEVTLRIQRKGGSIRSVIRGFGGVDRAALEAGATWTRAHEHAELLKEHKQNVSEATRHAEEIVKGFLSGEGSWEGTYYSRLLEITSQFAAPRPPTPIPDPSIPLDPTASTVLLDTEPIPEPKLKVEAEPKPKPKPEPGVMVATNLGIPAPTTVSGGGFHFMQKSELNAPADMGESQKWVAAQPTVNSEDIAVNTEDAQADMDGEVPNVDVVAELGGEVAQSVTGGATFGSSSTQTPIAQPAPATSSAELVTEDNGLTSIPGGHGHGTRGLFGGERGYRGRGCGRGG
ncbi:hypothetical protein FRC07_003780 [Ceratobasidium sp. 392]|nr:hypothetical protein FRC07_003780 [Ceratobasidium sp. 392]